jgi:hypothetical protein
MRLSSLADMETHLIYDLRIVDILARAFAVKLPPNSKGRMDAMECKSIATGLSRSACFSHTKPVDLTFSTAGGATVDIFFTCSSFRRFFGVRAQWRRPVHAGTSEFFIDGHISDATETALYQIELDLERSLL